MEISSVQEASNQDKANQLYEEIMAYEQDSLADSLSLFVMRQADMARSFRSSMGVDDQMIRAVNAVNLRYNDDECDLLDENAIYMGLTSLKVRAFRSWMSDILMNAEDKPWTIKPTPMPDLPEEVEDFVVDQVLLELQEAGLQGDLLQRMSTLKRLAQAHIEMVTREAAEKMELTVNDQLLEGGWRAEFDKFIDDLGTMPAAIMKGPVLAKRPRMRWVKNDIKVVEETTYEVLRVDPFNFYPSADSRSPNDGTYVVERMPLTATKMHDYEKIEGFLPEAIRSVTTGSPGGWSWLSTLHTAEPVVVATSSIFGLPLAPTASTDVGASQEDDTNKLDAGGLFDVLVYYGVVKGDLLTEYKIKGVTPSNTYEAEVWVCNSVVIRALLNPHPLKKRPFFATSFDKSPGSFWGRALPALLNDIQRVANAAARALVKNMAFTAGPIGEYDASRLSMEEDITEVVPYRLYSVDADPIMQSNLPAFRFHNVPSSVAELNGIYERYVQQADNVSGVPAYVLGDPSVAGAGRTLGGLSLLMGNAAKGIKRIIASVDKDVIEPLVTAYVHMNLLYSDDPSIKFDTQVVARGSSGLLQRELSQARAVEVLQMLTPYTTAGLVPKEGLQIVIGDVVRGLGYSADQIIPDASRSNTLENFVRMVQGGGREPPPAGQELDERIPAALNIQQPEATQPIA